MPREGEAPAPTGPAARAEQLFLQGLDAADRGEHAAACAKFAESLELVTRPGTLLNMATCETELGKVASAYRHLEQGIALLPADDARLPLATQHLDALAARVPRLQVKLAAGTPATARLLVDDVEVPKDKLGAILLEVGTAHTLVLAVPGHRDATRSVELAEGERQTLELAPGPALPGAAPVPEKDYTDPTLITAGIIVGAIGVAGGIAAGVTGGLIVSNDSSIQDDCPNQRCTPEGIDLVETNDTLLLVNGITFAVGAAGIGVGAVLILVGVFGGGPEEEAAAVSWSPMLGPTGGGLVLGGRF
jgi:hypothetical protein